jgi:peptidoglycan/xylan/chitin deacetylase (PgdA/CDA1 family)
MEYGRLRIGDQEEGVGSGSLKRLFNGAGRRMIYKAVCSVSLLFILGFGFCYSGTAYAYYPDTETLVCLWKGDKDGAVSITFDDTMISQYTMAYPLLKEYQFCGTYFTVVNFVGWTQNQINAAQLCDLAANGQEIGSHTVSHPRLTEIPYDQMVYELEQSKIMLEQITGKPVDTVAYPWGAYNNNVVLTASMYYISGRSATVASLNGASPHWYSQYLLRCIAPHYTYGGGDANAILCLQYWADQAGIQHKWAIEMFHSIGDPTGYDNVGTAAFETHLIYLSQNQDRLWVAPMGTVTKYIYERDAAYIDTDTDTNVITVDVDCCLDSRFNEPLTLLTLCPDNWLNRPIVGQQGNSCLIVQKYSKNNNVYLMYNAEPNSTPIILYPIDIPPTFDPNADFDNSGIVDNNDLAILCQAWQVTSEDADWQDAVKCDLHPDGIVDFQDFAIFARSWQLEATMP